MKVQVRLFAVAREIAEADELEVEVADTATAREITDALAQRVPALTRVLAHSFLAVDGEFASPDQSVSPTSEVALIPPVSGG